MIGVDQLYTSSPLIFFICSLFAFEALLIFFLLCFWWKHVFFHWANDLDFHHLKVHNNCYTWLTVNKYLISIKRQQIEAEKQWHSWCANVLNLWKSFPCKLSFKYADLVSVSLTNWIFEKREKEIKFSKWNVTRQRVKIVFSVPHKSLFKFFFSNIREKRIRNLNTKSEASGKYFPFLRQRIFFSLAYLKPENM